MKKGGFKNQRNKRNKRKTKKKSRFSKRKTNKKYNHRRKKTHNKRGGAEEPMAPPATLPGDEWVEVGAEVWPGCGIKTHIELRTLRVYRILKESKIRHGKFLIFIVEEREIIRDGTYLSGIYHKIYFVDDEKGTHEQLNEKYANKEFETTNVNVRGSTPLGCSIAGWGFESLSTGSTTQPLYKGVFGGPSIPSHLQVFSLKTPEDLIEVGGKPGKYKGVTDNNFSINPIRLALDPETYTSEGEGANESANLNSDLSFLCINGYGKGKKKEFVQDENGEVVYDGDEQVITINGLVGIVAKTRFKSGNGTVMALLNNSFEDNGGRDHNIFYTEDTYHRDFIIRHLGSLVFDVCFTEQRLQANEKVANLDYIFFQSETRVKDYALIGETTGNLVHFQSELDRDYKVGIERGDPFPRKTMCIIDGDVQMKCYFDTHPEYPLEVDDGSGKNKNLLIFKLDEVEKIIINIMRKYPDILLTPNKYQIKRSGGGWSDVERIELKHNGTVNFFFQGRQKPKTMVEVEEALKVADTESHTFLKLK